MILYGNLFFLKTKRNYKTLHFVEIKIVIYVQMLQKYEELGGICFVISM